MDVANRDAKFGTMLSEELQHYIAQASIALKRPKRAIVAEAIKMHRAYYDRLGLIEEEEKK